MSIGLLLLATHILACLSVGFLFRWWKKNSAGTSIAELFSTSKSHLSKSPLITLSNFGEILSKSILNSIHTLVLIGGFVVLFSIIISMLENSGLFYSLNDYASGIVSGILELTNGVQSISAINNRQLSTGIIASSFLIGFGGLSVLLQVLSIVSKQRISIKPYIIGKLLQGFFAAFYTFLILRYSLFFNLNL